MSRTIQLTNSLKSKYRYSIILLKELVVTEFKLRYQGSVLGYLWSLLKPLFLFVILYIVFVYFLKIGAGIPHWPVSMLLGIVMWNFFAEITNLGLKSIVSRSGIIRNINFPKYIIITASSVSALINLSLNLLVVVVFMIINKVEPSWSMALLPVYIFEVLIFGLGIAFFLSAIYVKLRDIQYIWEVIMQGLFYASAIIYPISRVSTTHKEIAQIMLLNPVAQAVQDARYVFISDTSQTLTSLSGSVIMNLIPISITILIFILGARYFKHKSPYFAEKV
ncbi:MAG: ABC transporter permease [Candidatus Saccharimonadales bacterium]